MGAIKWIFCDIDGCIASEASEKANAVSPHPEIHGVLDILDRIVNL
ncbi:hypothetical protein IT570_14760 [Candidatus Sumerlaeota bacterium]|nr:hypothetical protein [Candidatus Sumerlaeota bacterium]